MHLEVNKMAVDPILITSKVVGNVPKHHQEREEFLISFSFNTLNLKSGFLLAQI
jgi:hypothetical protein